MILLSWLNVFWDFVSGVVFLASQCALVAILLGAVFYRSGPDGITPRIGGIGRAVIGLAIAACLVAGAVHLVLEPLRAATRDEPVPKSLMQAAFTGHRVVVRFHPELCNDGAASALPCDVDLAGAFDVRNARWTFEQPASAAGKARSLGGRVPLRVLGLLSVADIRLQFDDSGRIYRDRDEVGMIRLAGRAP